jgi:hypothetical protein
MATELQTYEKINKCCNCEHVSVGVFSCKWCERSERQVLNFLIHGFCDVAVFQLVKGDFPLENIVYICSLEQLKNNGFSFTKIGNLCLIY